MELTRVSDQGVRSSVLVKNVIDLDLCASLQLSTTN